MTERWLRYWECIRGCRFCQAGFIYRPFREKSIDTIKNETKSLCEQTGYEEVSLSSLSTSDYTEINKLLENLVEYTDGEQINLSLPSLRIDNFSEELLEKNKVRKKKRSDLCSWSRHSASAWCHKQKHNRGRDNAYLPNGFRGGYSTVKLYFMLGLPEERWRTLRVSQSLRRKFLTFITKHQKKSVARACRYQFLLQHSYQSLFTPFEFEPQATPEEIKEKQEHLFKSLTSRKIRLSTHPILYIYIGSSSCKGWQTPW